MDIAVRQEGPWVPEDLSWLASRDGFGVPRSITLKTSLFTAGTHYPSGYVPSGVTLAKVTSGGNAGFWGPYDDTATDGRQVADGFLAHSVEMRTGGPDVGAALHWRGAVKTSRLPSGHGLDTAGKTDLAGKFRFE